MDQKYLNQDRLVGNWESINLNPIVMVHRNGSSYLLSIIYMNDTTRKLTPSTYEIQEDEQGYIVCLNGKHSCPLK